MAKRPSKTAKITKKNETKESKTAAADEQFLLVLSQKNTGENVSEVVDTLLEKRGQNLVVDAKEVERMDTPFVEALLATSKLWSADGFSIEFKNVSKTFEEILELLGLSVSTLEVGDVVK